MTQTVVKPYRHRHHGCLVPLVQKFVTKRLICQPGVSTNAIASYRTAR